MDPQLLADARGKLHTFQALSSSLFSSMAQFLDSVEGSSGSLRAELQCLAQERQRLADERNQFDAEARWIAHTAISPEDVVTLNVGGEIFTTKAANLHKAPSNMLSAWFSGRHRLVRDEEGRVFIDRDPNCFRYVLDYLRNRIGETDGSRDWGREEKEKVRQEFDYFCIPWPYEPEPLAEAYAKGSECVVLSGFDTYVRCVDVSETVVVGGSSDSIRVWDVKTGEGKFVFDTFDANPSAVAVSENYVAGGFSNGRMVVWDLATGQISASTGMVGCIEALKFCPGGTNGRGALLALYQFGSCDYGDEGGMFSMWTQDEHLQWGQDWAGTQTNVLYSVGVRGGLIYGGHSREVAIWNQSDGKRKHPGFWGHSLPVVGVAATEQRIASMGWVEGRKQELFVWDTAGNNIWQLSSGLGLGFAFSPGALVIHYGDSLMIRSTESEAELAVYLRGHTEPVSFVAVCGQAVVSASHKEYVVRLWRPHTHVRGSEGEQTGPLNASHV